MTTPVTEADVARLREFCEARTERRGANECWPWAGGLTSNQRGAVNIPGFRGTAPRASLILEAGGPPFEKAEACHSCDNPNCVNPKHLWWGTHKQNLQDASAKKRLGNGRTHCKRGHPLTPDNVTITRSAACPHGRRCKTCDNAQRREKRRLARGK